MADDIRAGAQADRAAPAGLVCPVCRVDLVMSERQGIEIDYCPRCRGVWLDRGELDKILERSAAELAVPPQTPFQDARRDYDRDYRRDDDDYKHYKKHRRRSFLEELFD